MAKKRTITKPSKPRGTKPVEVITDRAKRYRANQEAVRPASPRACVICGSTRNVEVHHADGNESNGRADNLVWACRSCNTGIAAAFKRAGLGVPTNQFNPGRKKSGSRVPSYGEYMEAAAQHRRGARDAGGAVIHRTPKATREIYSKMAWDARRERGTDRPGGSVPF